MSDMQDLLKFANKLAFINIVNCFRSLEKKRASKDGNSDINKSFAIKYWWKNWTNMEQSDILSRFLSSPPAGALTSLVFEIVFKHR